ncbi:CpsD/CapB family tyrosine-protein kinase, partial [Cetobacterium sp.]|uniref:CpsD/CapB family tyrosine-protein kinase n=1 Tax=Cetobacterium sp. TaxID=2071632 RepID=UPI003F371939
MGSKKLDEAFRAIRTNLHFLNEKENSRVILITSSIPKEGKSVVASNYAMSLAKIGEKVLIIDCNLKKTKIDEKFGLFFEKGLESTLVGEYEVEDLILKNVEKNLDVLPIKKITDDITSFFLKKNLK